MIALTRYQLALLAGSQRWLPPLLLYAILVVIGSLGGQPLNQALGWNGAALLFGVGWLTRAALTAEPAAARACVAAAAGPRRVHLAALTVALLGGLVLTMIGTGYELLLSAWPSQSAGGVAAQGIAAELVCVLVGVALGAVCSPPMIRRVAHGVLTLGVATVVALVAGVSPAAAAIRGSSGSSSPHVPVLPLLGALVLAAVLWTVSAIVAARRGDT